MESNVSLPTSGIATLLKQEVKPVFLLGAGASVRSGIPLSEHLVEAIAKWGYCKTHDRGFDDPTIMRSDWRPWLEQQHWFQENIPLADNYPHAVAALLKPRVNRKEFFQYILRPGVPPSPGYFSLARLLARKVIRTVLTTNFDSLVVTTARSLPEVYQIDEIKTKDDFQLFSTNPRYPQVLYIHGSVDHYTDQNIEQETNTLDSALVDLLKPLLRDHPIVVVGYRGAEPSVMRHLLIDQCSVCQGYRHGIYWCHLKDHSPFDSSPLLCELAGVVDHNFQFVEIEGFDELMAHLDRALPELVRPSTPTNLDSKSSARSVVHDIEPSTAKFDDLNEALLRAKLLAYAEAVRLPRPEMSSSTALVQAAAERSLVISDSGIWKPTNGGVLLFAKRPGVQFDQARVEIKLRGPNWWIAEILERPVNVPTTESKDEENITITGDLWAQLEKASDLLARVNKPFRLKGPTSQSVYRYPPLALKELLTNMFAHRDYRRKEASVIAITPEEIRLENPGGLVEHVRKQLDDREIQSAVGTDGRGIKGYRNPVIADFFFSAGAMDKEGSGLPDVLAEATNNLNEVAFGPTRDNGAFVATMQCRPEALTVDSSTRTAKTNAGELRYSPNLLTISRWPEQIWKLGTMSEPKDFAAAGMLRASPFSVNKNWIWTFADPNCAESNVLRPHVLEEEVHRVSTAEFLSAKGPGTQLPRLLNMALTNHLLALELRPKQEGGRIRAYYPSLEGQPREITYRGRFKQATRTVAKPIVSRATGRIVYWEHKAVALRFERFGATWCLSLVPCYVFTADGDFAPIASEKIGPLSTRRASRDYNPSVLHDMVFWSRVLAMGKEPLFYIPLVHVLPLDDRSIGNLPTIELTAMLPTVVFQEPVDANMAATVVGMEMPEEERLALQAEIEKAIEETSEGERDNAAEHSDS